MRSLRIVCLTPLTLGIINSQPTLATLNKHNKVHNRYGYYKHYN